MDHGKLHRDAPDEILKAFTILREGPTSLTSRKKSREVTDREIRFDQAREKLYLQAFPAITNQENTDQRIKRARAAHSCISTIEKRFKVGLSTIIAANL